MNLQELIDFHVTGAEACEAYAVTPGASEAKNKDIAKHYTKRAKWHRDAVELMKAGKQRLSVAERRADVLVTNLSKIKLRLDAFVEAERDMPLPSVEVCQSIADAALKPAADCEHSFHYFGTEQKRRRCNWCNKLEAAEREGS